MVRSCLGGLDDRFVLTGSEECRVYVYHRQSGAGTRFGRRGLLQERVLLTGGKKWRM